MLSRKLIKQILIGGFLSSLIIITSVIIYVRTSNLDKIYNATDVPQSQAIIILGASLKPDGTPSDALKDRLITGAELYNLNKAPKILITGDDGQNNSDEVSEMKKYLLSINIPEQDIIRDDHGYRTYESCKRAKEEFQISNAILVTQKFHLVRALYICNTLSVNSVGVTSDLQTYQKITQFVLRDWLASFKAWIDINIWEPKPLVFY